MKLKITHDKLIIQPKKCIFVGHFRFLNFDLGGGGGGGSKFVISDFVNSPVPNFSQIKLLSVFLSVIFGLAVRLALLDSPPPTIYKIYNKVAERLPQTTQTYSQTQFIDKQNLDTFTYQIIGRA